MKSLPQKHSYILERFIQLNEIPTTCENTQSLKKIIMLKNIYTEQKCIMKIQPKQLLQSRQRNVLHEASFYQKFQGHIGVPLMIWSGQDFDCLVLILEELGLTIFDRLKNYCPSGRMRIKDACMVGIQLLEIVKNFHEKDHIVKNISPETFSFGRNEKITKIYMNDMLYMKKFKAKNDLNHIQMKQKPKPQFLTPFLSHNVLSGKQASRRDDIISVLYVIIYLIKGKLPWQEDWEEDIRFKSQEVNDTNSRQQVNLVFRFGQKQEDDSVAKVQRMRQIQESIPLEQLCKDVPRQIKEILELAYELEFTDEPEYYRYISMLNKALFKKKLKNDSLFQWMESKEYLKTNLKADAKVLRLETMKQKHLESLIYEPFEQKVDLEISYEQDFGKPIGKTTYAVEKSHKNQNSASNRKYNQPSIKRKNNNCQLI